MLELNKRKDPYETKKKYGQEGDLSQIILIGSQSSRELNYVLYDSSVNQYYWVEGASVYFAGVPCYNLDYALISNMSRKNFKEVKLSLRQTSGEQLTREVHCSPLLPDSPWRYPQYYPD